MGEEASEDGGITWVEGGGLQRGGKGQRKTQLGVGVGVGVPGQLGTL